MKPKDLATYGSRADLEKASAAGLHGPEHGGGMDMDHMGHAHGPTENIRTADYRGHDLEIRTTYQVFIDGAQIAVPFHVGDDGQVTCHAVPNYSSPTALDVARRIVDAYPHRYPERKPRKKSRKKGM